jgi:phosphatidylserine/phosphatidylglycerophosphate/cardiolipin synthase-like enzyme
MYYSLEKNYFNADAHWNTWKGRIVRAIVLNEVFTKGEILKATNLKEKEFDQASNELFPEKLLEEMEDGKFWVKRELYGKCLRYFAQLQKTSVDWVSEWRVEQGIASRFSKNLSHFYLAGRFLSKFSESLIEHARQEILVTNPFVKRCHITEALTRMNKLGVCVKLVTRGIDDSKRYGKELANRVFITYDDSIHAKQIVVDGVVGIVSSMNFYAGSSAGECWEAGIATTNASVTSSITHSIKEKFLSERT